MYHLADEIIGVLKTIDDNTKYHPDNLSKASVDNEVHV